MELGDEHRRDRVPRLWMNAYRPTDPRLLVVDPVLGVSVAVVDLRMRSTRQPYDSFLGERKQGGCVTGEPRQSTNYTQFTLNSNAPK
jgi:hypothetical protein